ncbi:serine protease inhibitor 88Ea-like [Nylanderia fulva]|uniref:serine protease inhibitor 88Ea-like n=1 Tax=Nylanderia fulva TaxID=613905 RepID=UPI0010FB3BC9|nr:serine protease inhibitor 88Ea-like [Nylanderia fulva]
MAGEFSDNETNKRTKMTEQYLNQIEEILTKARIKFAIKCLCSIMDLKKNKNIVFSPSSIYEGLLLIYLTSSNDTEKQLRRKLELPDNCNTQNMITDYILYIMETKNTGEKLLNYKKKTSCWITNSKFVSNVTQRLFKGELELVNFHRTYYNLKNQINEFLRRKTKDYIRTPVQFNHINKEMQVILSTVLCLKDELVKENTSTKQILRSMHSSKIVRSFASRKLKMIVTKLPFVDKNISFFLLIPAWRCRNEWFVYKISDLAKQLMTEEGIDELRGALDAECPYDRFDKKDDIIYPDSFELENELEMDKLLDKLGIQDLLQPDKATLSKFTDENLHFGGAIHRAYIKVTTENVIASTVNMFFTKKEASFNSSNDINNSACTQNFLWLLYCKKSRTILFIGSINKENPLSPSEEGRGFVDRIRKMFK